MRMFAGPNGSGKSALKSYLAKELLGVYLNPDEIEAEIRRDGFLKLANDGAAADEAAVQRFFRESTLLRAAGMEEAAKGVFVREGELCFSAGEVNSYLASVTVDFLRQALLRRRASFTFETVMSHRSK